MHWRKETEGGQKHRWEGGRDRNWATAFLAARDAASSSRRRGRSLLGWWALTYLVCKMLQEVVGDERSAARDLKGHLLTFCGHEVVYEFPVRGGGFPCLVTAEALRSE